MIQTIKPGQQMKVKGLNSSSRHKDGIFSNQRYSQIHGFSCCRQCASALYV